MALMISWLCLACRENVQLHQVIITITISRKSRKIKKNWEQLLENFFPTKGGIQPARSLFLCIIYRTLPPSMMVHHRHFHA